MKSLAEIKNEFIKNLSSQYSQKEIDIIFFTLAENYLHKNKTILKLGLNEKMEDSEIKPLLFQNALFHLISGVPYQYVVGNTEFFGCKILVNKEVLIPRPETEELVEWIIKDFHNNSVDLKIMDLCTGSGCIAIALAKNLNGTVSGIDINEKAIELAKKNAEINQVKVNFLQVNLVTESNVNKSLGLDIIVSNPPYIREFEKELMDNRVVNYEPSQALFVPNEDPLLFYKRIISYSLKNLKPEGNVYVEINQELAKQTEELFLKFFNYVELKQDLSGNFRMIKANNIVL